MTTPDFAIHNVASESNDSVRTATGRHRFLKYLPLRQMQLLADGAAIYTGVFLGCRWGTINLNRTIAASRLIVASAIAAIAAMVICQQLKLYKADFSPLRIATTERLVRAITYLWVVALAGCILVNRSFVFAAASAALCASLVLATERGIRATGQRIIRTKCCNPGGLAVVEKTPRVRRTQDTEDYHRSDLWCRLGACDNNIPTKAFAPAVEVTGNESEQVAAESSTAAIALATPQIKEDQQVITMHECQRPELVPPGILGHSCHSDRNPRYRRPCELALPGRSLHPVESLIVLGRRGIDILGASATLLVFAPVFAIVAALIKIDSRGPIFFRHARVGRHARHFDMWKFRTMQAGADCYQRSPKSDNDPRLTRVGRILRRTSIDELPQLINVLVGDMSLVGPRPEMPFLAAKHNALARSRVRVKPGVTGLWQISPARAFPIHENIEYDLFYIDHQSLFLDCAILLRTLTAVVRGVGAA